MSGSVRVSGRRPIDLNPRLRDTADAKVFCLRGRVPLDLRFWVPSKTNRTYRGPRPSVLNVHLVLVTAAVCRFRCLNQLLIILLSGIVLRRHTRWPSFWRMRLFRNGSPRRMSSRAAGLSCLIRTRIGSDTLFDKDRIGNAASMFRFWCGVCKGRVTRH